MSFTGGKSCRTSQRKLLVPLLVAVILFLLSSSCSALEEDANQSDKKDGGTDNDNHVISLAESIQKSQTKFQRDRAKTMRTYWSKTLEEIKNLDVFFPETAPLLTQWKALSTDEQAINATTAEEIQRLAMSPILSNPPQALKRFDGFRSWERLLQEWTEDVAEYIEKNTVESTSYPMSTFGRPAENAADEKESVKGDDEATTIAEEPAAVKPEVTDADGAKEAEMDDDTTSEEVEPKPRARRLAPFPRTVRPGEPVLPHTDISDSSKSILIVTTASLPWMTGTAVNALLRAAYLQLGREAKKVTLMVPWLEVRSDQVRVYGEQNVFDTPSDQEEYVRTWLRETANMEEAAENLNIAWYNARQEQAENSIYSMGDITAFIPADNVDICILEEPEHLNWYRAPGENWTTKFKHVVGIVHTNYFVYAQEQPAAFIRAPAMKLLCSWMCRAHCHRLIKLSGTLDNFAPEKELVENVHGVRETFLEIGKQVRQTLMARNAAEHIVFGPNAEPTVYFIGKMLWSKGLGSLMELLKYAEESAGLKLHVDMYGGGPDKDAAEMKSRKLDIDMEYHGPVDHSKLAMSHKIFVNPSTSEVLCTTSAEALAMGKFVVLPSHPSNDFFAQFPNCLPYSNKEEFVGNLYYAMTHSPAPLTEEYAYALSWKAATERLAAAGSISLEEAEFMASALESKETGVEIDLPPLIDDTEQRRKIVSTIRLSRARYRQFRSRLSDEIKQSKVLPLEIRRRLSSELDKRLDLDIDTILESPKLRLQLSPAELDKRLLNFYNDVTRGASGDLLRLIGGGKNVGMQNLYMKRQALKQRKKGKGDAYDPTFTLPAFVDDSSAAATDAKQRTPTQWVTLALRRNLPSAQSKNGSAKSTVKNDSTTKMSLPPPNAKLPKRNWMNSPLI